MQLLQPLNNQQQLLQRWMCLTVMVWPFVSAAAQLQANLEVLKFWQHDTNSGLDTIQTSTCR